jgi:molybdenum cofactor cytidylyltransferase
MGPPLRFSAVLLAAGLSRRMGGPNKLLLPVAGEALVRRSARVVAGAGFAEVVVVTGYEAERIEQALAGLPLRFAPNPEYESGQVSSVRAGLAALTSPVDAVLVCLGDQPLLSEADLAALQQAFAARPHGSIVVPVRAEARGNPVALAWQDTREVLERGTNIGCRHFMERNPERVYRWPATSEHFFKDVDQPADYAGIVDGAGRAP